jgi:predicted PurR-regulated permease PerM
MTGSGPAGEGPAGEGPAGERGRRDGNGPFLVLVVAVAVILWLARGVLAPFIVAAVLAYAFSPLIDAVQARTSLSRVAVVAFAYLVAAVIIAGLVVLLAEQVAAELASLGSAGPDTLATTLRRLVGADTIEIAGQRIAIADVARELQARAAGAFASPGDAVHLAGQAGEGALQTLLAVIVTFYFLVDGASFVDRALSVLPIRHREPTVALLGRIHVVLGKWLRGQLLLIALVTAVVYVVLGPVLHLPYALAISVLTGVLEIIPLVGPLAATGIAAIDAFAHGGAGLAVVVIVVYLVIRQVEDQVVMPIVIGRAVHLHPVVTIFAVLVGLSVYGVLGGLLGVPIAAALNVVFRELYPVEPGTADLPTASPPGGAPAPSAAEAG